MRKTILVFNALMSLTVYRCVAQSNIPTSATGPAAATPLLISSQYLPLQGQIYQRVLVPVMPTTDTGKVVKTAVVDSVKIATKYFDDLGRPFEQITKQASPLKKDMVSLSVYDEFGRSNINYLPFVPQTGNTNDGYFKTSPLALDSAFYKQQFSNENIYYGVQTTEPSPLQRVIKKNAPGNSWAGANVGVGSSWRANTLSDSVRLWTIATTTEDDVPATTSVYAAGSMTVQQITDERGIKALVYTDELGRKILTKSQVATSPTTGHSGWMCTYYVYDEMNHLRMVIPPKAVDALNNSTANWNLTANATINTNLCFEYWYDSRGRNVMKRIPGKGKIYIAYDMLDRPAMTQDPNLRSTNQWAFISYDGQSRPDTTGLITSGLVKDTIIAQAARSAAYPAITGTYTITGVTYYDDYSYITPSGSPLSSALVTTNINSTNFVTTYNTSPLYAQQITASSRTRGLVTGSRKLVVNSSTFLWSLNLFDDHGRTIQGKQTNYTGGTDVATVQYSFNGRLLSSLLAHQKSGANAQTHTLLTKYSYDHFGRLLTVSKNLDNLATKTVSTNTFSEVGTPSTKALGSSIETQTYSYNIRGWLLGINSNYVNTSGSTANYYGETVAYDYGFTNVQVNGDISGTKWKAKGDGIARAYGFTYDNANRLTIADFSQQNSGSTSWTQNQVDYSVTGLSYDNSGNILSMKQRGLVDASPATVDSLTYQYFTNSNQLEKVSDGATNKTPIGDFQDTTYTGDDYTYDANGNTLKDYNRHMVTSTGNNGAVYNYLNKPDSIVVNGKAGIHYYYDAAGTQLRKQENDYTTGSLISKNYVYVGGFVYLNDTLQYVLHEEGQIRYAKKTNSSTGATYYAYEYDYFIKDHLGNVRTVLTEGSDTTTYAATMESKDSAVVAATFSNVYSPVNNVVAKPSGFDTDTSNHKVAVLNNNNTYGVAGPSIVLKVMAGDQVQINTYAYYNTTVQAPPGGANLLSSILGVLGTSIVGSSGGKFGSSEVTNINNAASPDVTSFLSGRSYNSSLPKAYLNWILFDDQFNYVSSNSGVVQVLAGSSKQALVAPNQNIVKNGYLYVYVSNESPQNVYFDNITVKQITGPLQQEQSYYPYGLPMAGIGDKALLKKNTVYKGDGGIELEEDYGLEYYNTSYRKYDPQIGRFTGVDVKAEDYSSISPYRFGFNNPMTFNDPTGALENQAAAEYLNILQQIGDGESINSLELDGKSANDITISDANGITSGEMDFLDGMGNSQLSFNFSGLNTAQRAKLVEVLNNFKSVDAGNWLIQQLMNFGNTIIVNDNKPTGDATMDYNKGGVISVGDALNPDGTASDGDLQTALSHELFHAYQDFSGLQDDDNSWEIDAFIFQSIYGHQLNMLAPGSVSSAYLNPLITQNPSTEVQQDFNNEYRSFLNDYNAVTYGILYALFNNGTSMTSLYQMTGSSANPLIFCYIANGSTAMTYWATMLNFSH